MEKLQKIIEQIFDAKESIQMLEDSIRDAENELRNELRKYREEQGISLRQLAEKWGISPSYLSDIELGRRNFSATIIDKILLTPPAP